jgi:hypothetical protein
MDGEERIEKREEMEEERCRAMNDERAKLNRRKGRRRDEDKWKAKEAIERTSWIVGTS